MITKPILRLAAITVILFCSFYVSARELTYGSLPSQSPLFIENKGQVRNQDGVPAADVKYIYSAPGFKLILKGNSFSYEVYTIEKLQTGDRKDALLKSVREKELIGKAHASVIRSHRIDIALPGANARPEIIAEGMRRHYRSYHHASVNEGLAGIYSYDKVTYKNIYPNIDFVFYADKSGEGSLKYDIVVHPGGRLQDVKMEYQGAGMRGRGGDYGELNVSIGLHLKNDKLILPTSVRRSITETIPYSFIRESGENVSVQRELNGNTVSFKTDVPAGNTLVIDPILTWGTYFGGIDDEEIYAMTTDKSGNIYVTGYTGSSSDIATSGSHQASYAEGIDAFLAKFNGSGVLQWSTYFGDFDEEQGYDVATDTSGNVYISGYTYSAGLATTGAHQATNGGEVDAFLAKFNSSGTLQWSTYYGDAGDDYGFSVATDKTGNVFLSGYTFSTSGIATSGAHQTSNAGVIDAFLVKFNSSGVRQWGTYFGGDDVDVNILGLATDGSGNVYMSGLTYSTAGISSSGAFKTTIGGDADGFIAKFNSSGTRQWSTYYGGTGEDIYYDLKIDASGNVIAAGYTISTTGIASSGAHQTSLNGSNYDAFISKFNSGGQRQWGTYYGGAGTDAGFSVVSDASGNIYLTGTSESTSGIATSKTHQTSNAGGFDAFIAKFSSSGSRQWGTYYGGSDDDQAYGIALDASLNILIAGSTYSTSGMATTGAHQTSYAAGYDAFLTKFEPFKEDAGVTNITSPLNSICPGTHSVSVRIKNFGNVDLDSVRVGWSVNGVAQTVFKRSTALKKGDTSAAFTIGTALFKSGTNVVKVWTLKPNGAADVNAANDTLKINIEASPLPSVTFSMPRSCAGDAVQFTNASSISAGSIAGYAWKFGDGGTSSDVSPSHVYTLPGVYEIWLIATSDKGCKDSAKLNIAINPVPKPGFTSASSCAQGSTTFKNTSTLSSGTMTFTWDFGDGTGSADKDPVHTYASAGTYDVTLTAVSDSGCTDAITQTVTVTANPAPVVKFTADDGCSPTVSFTNESTVASGTITSYLWDFGDAGTSTDTDPSHTYAGPGSYTVTLKATTNNGCTNTFSKVVTVFPTPVASFTTDAKCAGSAAAFTNTTTISSGSITTYSWDFGDGSNTSSDENPTHTFGAAGTYPVSLTVTSDKGCSHKVTISITIYTPPTSGFTHTAEDRKLTFTPDDGTQASYVWRFGDGDTSIAESPVHTYAADGTYNVTLQVTSAQGCKSTTTKSVTVKTSGISENSAGNSWKIFPNPATDGYIIVEGQNGLPNADITLYDVLGRKVPVLQQRSTGHFRLTLPENTVPGIYYLTITNGGTHRIVIE